LTVVEALLLLLSSFPHAVTEMARPRASVRASGALQRDLVMACP
jgi:hypothetical protein